MDVFIHVLQVSFMIVDVNGFITSLKIFFGMPKENETKKNIAPHTKVQGQWHK